MSRYPLEPDPGEMEAMGRAALDTVAAFIANLPDAPVDGLEDAEDVAAKLRGAPPESGRAFEDVIADFELAAATGKQQAGPGYLAFIPGGGLYASALASFLAAGVNRFVNLAGSAPAFVQLEDDVIRWLCDLFELPPATSGGILTSGGSLANFSAIVTARDAMLPEDFLGGTLYVSEQAHASVAKAASLAGFPATGVRQVPVDGTLRMDVDALVRMVREDRAGGRTPFLVAPAAGTTNTGAIDPLDAIADVCEAEGLWLHVDAAYGGFFRLTARGRGRFRGIERVDSITLDPHKGMFLPYGTGSLLVRDASRLRHAHFSGASYLQDLISERDELPNFSEYSPELSRDFRGLRVWLPLQLHGIESFRSALDEKLDLAELVDAELRQIPGIEVPWPAELSIVAFRVARDDPAEADERGRRLLERINASRRVFLSSTVIDGRYTLRVAILSHRTHRDRIDELLEIVRAAAAP